MIRFLETAYSMNCITGREEGKRYEGNKTQETIGTYVCSRNAAVRTFYNCIGLDLRYG